MGGQLAFTFVDLANALAPDEFGRFIRSEIAKWAKLVKDAGIQPQ